MRARAEASLWEEWGGRWRTCQNGGTTRRYVPDQAVPAELLRGSCFGLPTGYILTGHGSLNEYLHRRTLSETPLCRCGEVDETFPHVLLECRRYEERRDLEAMGVVRGDDGAWDCTGVVNSPRNFQALRRFAAWAFDMRTQVTVGDK